jgi:hypothetical protein
MITYSSNFSPVGLALRVEHADSMLSVIEMWRDKWPNYRFHWLWQSHLFCQHRWGGIDGRNASALQAGINPLINVNSLNPNKTERKSPIAQVIRQTRIILQQFVSPYAFTFRYSHTNRVIFSKWSSHEGARQTDHRRTSCSRQMFPHA